MPIDYVLKRIGFFVMIVWLAATLNFFIPRLSNQNPVRERLIEQAVLGGYIHAGMKEMVAEYEVRFGLDQPLYIQYFRYMGDLLRGDFNYSIANFPRTVKEMLAESLPWTIGLLATTTVLSFVIGTLLGAFMGWPRAPKFLQYVLPPLLALHALPFYLFGLVLMYFLAFKAGWFPIFGGYTPGQVPELSFAFAADVVQHAMLPALSIILVSIGGWALTMRAMIVTVQGEDFITFADAKGLKASTIFIRYALRNTMLPQATAFALALGQIVAGGVLVEVVFGYPGVGSVLFAAIRQADWFLIQGAVFCIVVTIGLATLILDLIYPKLDPRITYRKPEMSVTPNLGTEMPGPVAAGQAAGVANQEASQSIVHQDRMAALVRYLRRNPALMIGALLLLSLVLFSVIGALTYDLQRARPLSVMAIQPPSAELPFGSDRQGRDLLAVMIAGTPLTIRIGLIAGLIGVGIGTVLAFISAYYGGIPDALIRGMVDIGLTVPGLVVLIILAVSIREGITVNQMALVVACLAWLYPTRVIRAQVLSMRERSWVQVARLSGMSGPEVIVKEMLPNLFPYLAAALVNSVSAAILASIGLEALGLGPIESPTLGMTVYWVQFNAAIINGWWWWWVEPIVILFILFVGLFLVSLGLDEIANPRLRRTV